jgi:hypothetical protein
MAITIYEQFVDDVDGVPDDTILYRRVAWDKIGGRARSAKGVPARLNSNCFTDWSEEKARSVGLPGPCMSIGVSIVLDRLGIPSEDLLEDPEQGLAYMTAGQVRHLVKGDGTPCPQGVMLCPTEREPWHGVVFDVNIRPRTDAVRKSVARVAAWSIPLINHG